MADIYDTDELSDKQLRLIVIDDEPEWCNDLATTAEVLGYKLASANTLEEAKLKIQEAERQGVPFDVALIDMNFEMGKKKIEVPRGKEVVRYIKTHHAPMACIMVSGSSVTPEMVLDLRDDYDLDYYIQKHRFDIDAFARVIKKVVARARSGGTIQRRQQELQKLLGQWQDVHLFMSRNLAIVRRREAIKGIDVDVKTIHEIEQYEAALQEATTQIQLIEQRLAVLG